MVFLPSVILGQTSEDSTTPVRASSQQSENNPATESSDQTVREADRGASSQLDDDGQGVGYTAGSGLPGEQEGYAAQRPLTDDSNQSSRADASDSEEVQASFPDHALRHALTTENLDASEWVFQELNPDRSVRGAEGEKPWQPSSDRTQRHTANGEGEPAAEVFENPDQTQVTTTLGTGAEKLAADLEIPSIGVSPNPGYLDQSFTVTLTVQNVGTTSVSSREVEYYLSTNTTITTSDYYLGNDYVTLSAGASGSETITVNPLSSVSGLSAGTYYVGVRIPDESEVWRRNSAIDIFDTAPAADLEIPTTAVSPNPGYLDQAFTITLTVQNVGTLAVSNREVEYYLSTNTTISTSDYYLGNDYVSLAAGANGSETITVNPLSSVSGLTAGTYYVGVLIPAENEVWRRNSTIDIFDTAPAADLEIPTTAVSPNPGYLDQAFTVTLTVQNVGTLAVSSREVEYYLSTNTTISASDYYLGNDYVTLAAGASGSETITVNPLSSVSGLTAGTYYVGVLIPDENETWRRTGTVDILDTAPTADLEIPTTTVSPNPGYLDQSFTVTLTVQNVGTLAVSSREVEYYLSTNSTISASDFYLGNDYVTLAAGASGSETITVNPLSSISGLTAGTYYVGVLIPDENETWRRTGTIDILDTAPAADLEIPTTAVSPNPGYLDQAFTLTLTVQNVGTLAVTSREVEYYLSSNTSITTSDFYLGNDYVTLAAGASGTETITVNPLASISGLTAGTYYVGVLIPDENETWRRTSPVDILDAIPAPDLEVPTFSVTPNPGYLNQSFTVTLTAQNVGNAAVTSREVEYYLSTNTTISTSDFYLGNDYVTLAAGASGTETITVNPLASVSGLTAGTYYVGVLIPDESEYWYRTGAVQIFSTASQPDLEIPTTAVSPIPAYLDQALTLTLTVQNVGSAAVSSREVEYYLSTNTTITTSDFYLGNDYVTLAAGASGTETIIVNPLSSVSGLTAGTYHVGVRIPDEAEIWRRSGTLEVLTSSSQGDLEVPTTSVSPNPGQLDQAFTLTLSVQNVGSTSVSNREVEYYLSTNTNITTSDFYLGNDYVSLAAGASGSETITINPLSSVNGLTAGTYYVGVRIPDEGESWYRNNAVQILGAGGSGATPDLFAFSPISSPQTLGAFSVTVSAESAGSQGIPVDYDGRVWLSTDQAANVTPGYVDLQNGFATTSVSVDNSGSGIRLLASAGGISGQSNSFDVTGSFFEGTLSGKVWNGTSLLDGAEVEVSFGFQSITATATGGYYQTAPITCGLYTARATYAGESSDWTVVNVPCGKNVTYDFEIPDACVATGVTPILLVPGFMGSSTSVGSCIPTLPKESPHWRDGWPGWSYRGQGGLHQFFNIPTWTGLIRTLKNDVNANYQPNCALFAVPWDWRMDLDQAADQYLRPWIAEAKAKTGSDKVHVITHSTGALLVRSHLQRKSGVPDIDKFAMIAPPNQGATFTYYPWQGGDPLIPDRENWSWGCPNFYRRTAEGVFRAQHDGRRPPYRSIIVGSTVVQVPREPDYQIEMQEYFHDHGPSIKQLLPTVAFLQETQPSTIRRLVCEPNHWLAGMNEVDSDLATSPLTSGPSSSTAAEARIFAGMDKETINTINVGAKNCTTDGFYPDGHPMGRPDKPKIGDGTLLLRETRIPNRDDLDTDPYPNTSHVGMVKESAHEVAEFLCGCSIPESAAKVEAPVEAQLAVTLSDGRAEPNLVDPLGNQSGIRSSGLFDEEIPDSSVFVGPNEAAISVTNPQEGTFQVTVHTNFDEEVDLAIELLGEGIGTVIQRQFMSHPGTDFRFDLAIDYQTSEVLSVQHAPMFPAELTADWMAGDLTRLQWSQPADASISEFLIYSRQLDESTMTLLAVTPATFLETGHSWSGDASIPTRLYAVAAVDAAGEESFLSPSAMNNDRDHDGLSDADEIAQGSSVDDPDSDDDGLSDGEEWLRGTDASLWDSDGDGASDFEEVILGSDPLSATSIPPACVADLEIGNRDLGFDYVFEAGQSIVAGPSLRIEAPADVVLRAGQNVRFDNNFVVKSGATLSVVIDPSVACP